MDQDSNQIPVASVPSRSFRDKFRHLISKKVFQRVILPLIIVGLIISGLATQGFISDWYNALKRATATVTVVDEESKPIELAVVLIGDSSAITDTEGKTTVELLIAGKQTLTVRKTGFVPTSQEIILKKGSNDLGTISLKLAPTPRVDFTLSIIDYISEQPINDVTVILTDLRPIYEATGYKFTEVPIGKYDLEIIKSGYSTYFLPDITIDSKTKEVAQVKLVKAGVIVFESNRDGGKRGIFVANYDGEGQKALVSRVGEFEDYSPVLGPNQNKLFFTSTRDGVSNNSGGYKTFLYLIGIDGKNLTKISENATTFSAVWSPDGGYIGFTGYIGEGNNQKTRLYTYNVVTKTINNFSDYDVNYGFAFSQDGGTIAFSGSLEGTSTSSGLFIGSSTGQNIKKVDETMSYALEFTTTGKLRYSYYDNSTQKTRYFEYDPAANSKTEITAPAIDNIGAILSPDKKLRAYVSNRDGKSNLYVSDPDGKNEKKLTVLNKVVPGDVLWAKDSSFVMFNYRTEGESARYLVAANGKAEAKKIVDINLTGYYY